MFTSHTINSCKKMLHDYDEFNNFVDRVVAIMEEQKVREACENIKMIRSELESVHKELKISIAARDKEKTMKNLTITLNLLERLQQEFDKSVEEGPGEFFFNLGINYLHSMIERIVSKTNRKSRDENVRW